MPIRWIGVVVLLFPLTFVSPFTFAEGKEASTHKSEIASLREQIRELTQRSVDLERQLLTMEGHISPVQGKGRIRSKSPDKGMPAGLIHTVQDIHMGGYVAIEFNQNLTAETTNPPGNPLRSLDANQNTFTLNAVELDFQRTPEPTGGAGFRVDIAMGENNQIIDAISPGTDGDEFGLQEAYAEWIAPLKFFEANKIFSDVIDFKFGRFATLAGAELFEPHSNWNISRSFLYGLAEPASHTGIRSQYKIFEEKITLYAGVNNGWDSVVDTNMLKTAEAGLGFVKGDLSSTSVFYFGPENANQGGHRRFLFSQILLYPATEKLEFMGVIDYGNERRVLGLEGNDFENAQWHGYAGYIRYTLTPKWKTAYRAEFFRDDDTYRTGLSNAIAPSLWEQTVTLEYEAYENMLFRIEYRMDKSDDTDIFNGESSQSTLGSQVVYSFA